MALEPLQRDRDEPGWRRVANAAIKIEIGKSIERFRFFESGLTETLHSSGVLRDLSRRAIRVESRAKEIASQPPRGGVPNAGSQPGGGPAVRTGRLRGSITWRLGRDARGPYADIGSAVFYAPMVEKGTSKMEARPFLEPALPAAR